VTVDLTAFQEQGIVTEPQGMAFGGVDQLTAGADPVGPGIDALQFAPTGVLFPDPRAADRLPVLITDQEYAAAVREVTEIDMLCPVMADDLPQSSVQLADELQGVRVIR